MLAQFFKTDVCVTACARLTRDCAQGGHTFGRWLARTHWKGHPRPHRHPRSETRATPPAPPARPKYDCKLQIPLWGDLSAPVAHICIQTRFRCEIGTRTRNVCFGETETHRLKASLILASSTSLVSGITLPMFVAKASMKRKLFKADSEQKLSSSLSTVPRET